MYNLVVCFDDIKQICNRETNVRLIFENINSDHSIKAYLHPSYNKKDKYDKDDSALRIVEKGDMWKMDVKPEYSDLVNRLATGSSEFSKAEQETLAIIAYKQPIKQSVIIKIRGNKGYDHVKKFVDLGLLKKKKVGHTNELSLHDDFYDYFNVADSENPLKKDVMEVNGGEG